MAQASDRLFERLTESHSEIRTYRIGDELVRVCFGQPTLGLLLHRSLAHLECPAEGEAALTLHVMAGAAPFEVFPRAAMVAATIRWRAKPSVAGRPYLYHLAGPGGRVDLVSADRTQALICYRDARMIPAWDIAAPFRDLLHVWFGFRGGFIVHGAAVADRDRAVLLAGPGGAGKSSTTMACLAHSGLFYLGDDVVLVRPYAAGFRAYSLYNAVKLKPGDETDFCRRLDRLDVSRAGKEKSIFFTYPALSARLAPSRPIAGVLIVRAGQLDDTALLPAIAAEAWRAIGPATFALLPSFPPAIGRIGRFAAALPARLLEIGARRERIPPAIGRVLEEGM
ncbi:MAG: hypothetical protein KIT16_06950 [Rhodospirillaceae bacterium]|nr:hypothetical protein [Rhodospirillaceae bacterium]